MIDEQIFKKALEKSEKNGWKQPIKIADEGTVQTPGIVIFVDDSGNFLSRKDIIFSHDFAKSFWGTIDSEPCEYCSAQDSKKWVHETQCPRYDKSPLPYLWEFHLQQMVLEEQPILYLEQFLK